MNLLSVTSPRNNLLLLWLVNITQCHLGNQAIIYHVFTSWLHTEEAEFEAKLQYNLLITLQMGTHNRNLDKSELARQRGQTKQAQLVFISGSMCVIKLVNYGE